MPRMTEAELLDAAMFSVWLHGDWRYLTEQMTDPVREAAWAAVERRNEALGEEPLSVEWAWWR